MPSSNTTDFSETSVSLSWESGYSESLNHTGGSVTFGYSNGVDHIVVLEDLSNCDFLVEVVHSEVNLSSDVATVNLDFEEVSLLLSEVKFGELRDSENSDNVAVLLYSFQVSLDGLLGLVVFLPSLGVLCECLLLRFVPVLVESSQELLRQFLSVNS